MTEREWDQFKRQFHELPEGEREEKLDELADLHNLNSDPPPAPPPQQE